MLVVYMYTHTEVQACWCINTHGGTGLTDSTGQTDDTVALHAY